MVPVVALLSGYYCTLPVMVVCLWFYAKERKTYGRKKTEAQPEETSEQPSEIYATFTICLNHQKVLLNTARHRGVQLSRRKLKTCGFKGLCAKQISQSDPLG